MRGFLAKLCKKNGIAKRILSMSLAVLMALTTLQALPAGILVAKAAEAPTFAVTDDIAVKVGSTTYPMSLFTNVGWETVVALEAGSCTGTIVQNDTETSVTKTTNIDAAGNYCFRLAGGELTITAATTDTATIVGSLGPLGYSNDWKVDDTNADMTYIGGNWWLGELTFAELQTDATVTYKVAMNHAWGTSYGDDGGGGNITAVVPAGRTSFRVLLNKNTGWVYDDVSAGFANINSKGYSVNPFADNSVTLAGSMNGWNGTDNSKKFTQVPNSYGLYTYQETFVAGDYQYKCTINGNWPDGDNYSFSIAEDTAVMFVYDAASNTLYDTVNDKATIDELFALVKEEPKVPFEGNVTVHYKNDSSMESVYAYAWEPSNTSNQFLGGWPGLKLTENSTNDGWYGNTVSLDLVDRVFNIIFNNGKNENDGQIKTKDITVALEESTTEVWITGGVGADAVISTSAPNDWDDEGSYTKEVTLHYYNASGWSNVYADLMDGSNDIGTAFPGAQATNEKGDWYKVTVPGLSVDAAKVVMNDGTDANKDAALDIALSNPTNEYWIKGGEVLTTNPDALKSPVVNGTSVTFNYEDKNDAYTSLSIMGINNDWTTGIDFGTKVDGVFSKTVTLTPGYYEYKFRETGTNNWFNDDLNSNKATGGNNILIVSGMYSSDALAVEKGQDLVLPSTLSYVDAAGNAGTKTVTYALADNSDNDVTLSNGTLNVAASSELTSVDVIATATDDAEITATLTVKLNAAGVEVLKSPVVNGTKVTFNYEDTAGTANTVVARGSWDAWGADVKFTKGENDVWAATMNVAPNKYQYKFIVNGGYINDPLNGKTEGNDNNNVLIVPGLYADNELIAEKNVALDLPTTLNSIDAEGTKSTATVTYTLKNAEDASFATLSGSTLTIAPSADKDEVILIASNGAGLSSEVKVSIVEKLYTYTIYAYSPIASRMSINETSLWLWDSADETDLADANYPFTSTEVLADGKTWLKMEITLPCAQQLGLILRYKESWDKWQTENMFYSNADRTDQTIYLVDGLTEVVDDINDVQEVSKLIIEYTSSDGTYTNPYVEAWYNGYSYKEDGNTKNFTFNFENVNGKYIATVPVAVGSVDKTVGFNVYNKGNIDKESQSITIKAGEKVTKVKYANGAIASIVPDSSSYVADRANSKISFYYRDDALFAANNMHSISSVKLAVRTVIGDANPADCEERQVDMTWDAAEERFKLENQAFPANCDIYYYYIVDGTPTQDVKNARRATVSGQEYSMVKNRVYAINLTASVKYADMTYNDGNVLYVDFTEVAGFNPEKVYADLSAVGLGSKVEVDKELMALSFGCLEGTSTGAKTIEITLVDDSDMIYTATTTVNVKARTKTANTDSKLGTFDWDEAVIYFAVTDRFFDGNANNNTGDDAEAYDPADPGKYHGGDLAGLTKKIDYLYDLGVNTIWLTPIVDNSNGDYGNAQDGAYYAYHGYWASDFTKLNPHLGTKAELKALIDAAHAKGMKIMVDVVVNHGGYGEADTFNNIIPGMVRDQANMAPGDIKFSLSGLPDFMTEDPEVREQIIEWQTNWMTEFDIDFYRVDTVKHVENTTWNAFKNALVEKNQDFKLIGEYYDAGYLNDFEQLDTGRMDSVLDFNFNDLMLKLVNEDLAGIEKALGERNIILTNTATVGSFNSSHDEDGLLYTMRQSKGDWADSLMKVAATFQATAKGQPVIYYGEEIGLTGTKEWPAYTNRPDFDWNAQATQAADSNSMYNHYKKVLNIRRDYSEVFAKGTRKAVTADSTLGYEVFSRSYEDTTIYVGVNVHGTDRQAKFFVPGATGSVYKDLYSGKTYKVAADGSITVTIPMAQNGGTAILVGTGVAVQDTNEITVKVHYTRDGGDYTGWNLWAWSESGLGGAQYNFVEENGEMVATVKKIPGRTTSRLGYHTRLNEWDAQDYGSDQWIDLKDIVSGTVHYYINASRTGGTRVLGSDAIVGNKINSAKYDRKTNTVVVTMPQAIVGTAQEAFEIICTSTGELIGISGADRNGTVYTLELAKDITSLEALLMSYTIKYDGYTYNVTTPNLYSSDEFESAYAYDGDDLGLTYTSSASTFKLWAPTADSVTLNIYEGGTAGTADKIASYPMTGGTRNEKGVWTYVANGDLNGKYYTYSVNVANKVNEVCDPYARTTGVNGKRAMILDLSKTNPDGWAADKNAVRHDGMAYTDAVIYELHVRDLTIDSSSGVDSKYQGKFMGLTQTGTKTAGGNPTALDHMINLGITHLHLIPVYDYGSVDETKLDTPQFNWGYDPVNYNVPEGSYSTNPYDGSVRVKEMKQMIKTLHDNNINVIMDVVYNHVYDAETFAFNQVVPKYFSRTNADGTYSSRSGCGNDTASERAMVHKYIVDSILYWHNEYHIDGFRFDLVGLIDVNTINALVADVHAIDPDIIFYGEGWDMDSTAISKDIPLAKQGNASKTPGFGYFSDNIRNGIAGSDDKGNGWIWGNASDSDLSALTLGKSWWTTNPSQTINYVSCHDNYTLMDKINVVAAKYHGKEAVTSYDYTPGEYQVAQNNLSAAMYMFSEGIPLIHAGEDFLRTKLDESGEVIHNSYKSPDYVNKMRWSNLDKDIYKDTTDYYKGLIEFRKNHAVLRLADAASVASYVTSQVHSTGVIVNTFSGSAPNEVSDGIVTIFNATGNAVTISGKYGITNGTTWKVCVNKDDAGTDVLATITNGSVTVPAHSAMALVKGETVDNNSIYKTNNRVTLTLDKATLTTGIGGVVALTATTNTPATLTWVSSDTNVATVDEMGRVTAVATGSATITVSTYHGVEATCTVTVTDEVVPATITIDKTELTLVEGESETLVITVSPVTETATYSSTDETVATIDSTGKVTALKAGSTTVTAALADGQSVSCVVTVTPAPVEETVALNKTSLVLEIGDSETLTATVTPAGTKVSFSSKDTNVATVDANGKVTAGVEGKTEIVVVTAAGKTAICTVTVTKTTTPSNPGSSSGPGTAAPAPTPSTPSTPSTGGDNASDGASDGANTGVAPILPKPPVEDEVEEDFFVETEAEEEVPENVEEVTPIVDEKLQAAIKAETKELIEDIINDEVAEGTVTAETLKNIKDARAAGEGIVTEIIVDTVDESTIDNDVKAALEKALADSVKDKTGAETEIAQYLDLSVLLKTTSGKELGTINKMSKNITFTIAIPKELEKEGRAFVVLRMHEGETTVLETKMNADGTLSFQTDRFSTYALAYIDALAEDVVDDAEDVTPDETTPDGQSQQKEEGGNYTTFIIIGLIIVILAALFIIFFVLKDKKDKK